MCIRDRSFLPVNENNLIYKAAKLLMDEFSITDGVSVKLDTVSYTHLDVYKRQILCTLPL